MEVVIHNVDYHGNVGDLIIYKTGALIYNMTGYDKNIELPVDKEWLLDNFPTEMGYFAKLSDK